MARVSVQAEDFDVGCEAAALAKADGNVGAVVTFVGHCRDEDGRLAGLEIEHYPGMAEEEIGRVAAEAESRWPLSAVTVIHRFGMIRAGEQIVFVGAASRHRQAAFAAAEMLMDYLKSKAPFWKRPVLAGGVKAEWVEAAASDDTALKRWEAPR